MIPVWLEAVIYVDEHTTPEDGAAAVLPSTAKIIQAVTLDDAVKAMSERAAGYKDQIDTGRQMVIVARNAIRNEVLLPHEILESLDNIARWLTVDD